MQRVALHRGARNHFAGCCFRCALNPLSISLSLSLFLTHFPKFSFVREMQRKEIFAPKPATQGTPTHDSSVAMPCSPLPAHNIARFFKPCLACLADGGRVEASLCPWPLVWLPQHTSLATFSVVSLALLKIGRRPSHSNQPSVRGAMGMRCALPRTLLLCC
jgi:hypothetical protein